jgi:hypothetical protein
MDHTCNPSYLGDRDQEDHGSRSAWAKRDILSQIIKRAGVAQVVDCLPSKHKALSSNPSTEKKRKEGKGKNLTSVL